MCLHQLFHLGSFKGSTAQERIAVRLLCPKIMDLFAAQSLGGGEGVVLVIRNGGHSTITSVCVLMCNLHCNH